jgi:hypothetical protein
VAALHRWLEPHEVGRMLFHLGLFTPGELSKTGSLPS